MFLIFLFLMALAFLAVLPLIVLFVSRRGKKNTYKFHFCRRANYHVGPCNGFPRHTCEVYTHAC